MGVGCPRDPILERRSMGLAAIAAITKLGLMRSSGRILNSALLACEASVLSK